MLKPIAGAAYQKVIQLSSGPETALFKQFKKQWKSFDLSKFDDTYTEGEAKQGVRNEKFDRILKLRVDL